MKTTYSLYCILTGESQPVVVCDGCADEMPPVDDDRVRASKADDDVCCEFCVEY